MPNYLTVFQLYTTVFAAVFANNLGQDALDQHMSLISAMCLTRFFWMVPLEDNCDGGTFDFFPLKWDKPCRISLGCRIMGHIHVLMSEYGIVFALTD